MSSPKSAYRSSFRDPAGFVFEEKGTFFRYVSPRYASTFCEAERKGLLPSLVESGLLIPYERVPGEAGSEHLILQPERLRFVSYPYEWCFSQLRDAGLATLEVQRRCLHKGFWLKDASAYNIQFHRGQPLLVDLLSFERVKEGEPWPAYRQFCRHFLAPLALMSCRHLGLGTLFYGYPDGIPLDVAIDTLGLRGIFKFWVSLHLRAHRRAEQRYRGVSSAVLRRPITLRAHLGLVDSLEMAIRSLRRPELRGFWNGYRRFEPYTEVARGDKMAGVRELASGVIPPPKTVWDLGANVGDYSRLMASLGFFTVALDSERECVEEIYERARRDKEINVLPLVQDIANPSPSSGWSEEERSGLKERGPADLVLSLALVHHLRITHGIPFSRLAQYLSLIAKWLIIEYVPRSDPKVHELLGLREDVFEDYREEVFRQSFEEYFVITRRRPLKESERILYLMRRRRLD